MMEDVAANLQSTLEETLSAERIKEIASWIIERAGAATSTGAYIIEVSEIAAAFNVTEEAIRSHEQDFLDEIDTREEVLSETWTEEDTDGRLTGFNVNLCGNYVCSLCQEKNYCDSCGVAH